MAYHTRALKKVVPHRIWLWIATKKWTNLRNSLCFQKPWIVIGVDFPNFKGKQGSGEAKVKTKQSAQRGTEPPNGCKHFPCLQAISATSLGETEVRFTFLGSQVWFSDSLLLYYNYSHLIS